MKNISKPFRCAECGVGTVKSMQAEWRETKYKSLTLPIPADLKIPTCNHCGTEWIDDSTAALLDAALEKEYRARIKDLLKSTLEKSVVPKAAIERALGLSQGYLSHLTGNGDKVPSETLAYSVISIAENGTSAVEALWRRLSGKRSPVLTKVAKSYVTKKQTSGTASRSTTPKLSSSRSSSKSPSAKRAS